MHRDVHTNANSHMLKHAIQHVGMPSYPLCWGVIAGRLWTRAAVAINISLDHGALL